MKIILEIKITIDREESQDALQLLEMFKTMCTYSGCEYSTYQINNGVKNE